MKPTTEDKDWLSAQQAVQPDGTEVTNLPLINKKLPPLVASPIKLRGVTVSGITLAAGTDRESIHKFCMSFGSGYVLIDEYSISQVVTILVYCTQAEKHKYETRHE